MMAKRGQYYAEAHRLYVQERHTFEQIAKVLPVSERSLREWAKAGQWIDQRKGIEEMQAKSSEKLHRVMDKLLDRIIKVLDEDGEPNPALLHFVRGVAPSLVRLQDYEEAVAAQEQSAEPREKPRQLSEDLIRMIEEQILGIKR